MRRWLPYPLLALSLLVMWLLLHQSVSAGHVLLGGAVALFASRAMVALRPNKPRIRFSWAIPRLIGIVLTDIVRSNIAVGRIVLFGRHPARTSSFIHLPLDMRDTYGLAVLAIIITATPGTLWMQHDLSRNLLLVHILDLIDEDEWIRLIKSRYEHLLMEIFE